MDHSFSPYQSHTSHTRAHAPTPRRDAPGASTLFPEFRVNTVNGWLYLVTVLNLLVGLGFLMQVIVMVFERNRVIRFHAAQAILLGAFTAVIGVFLYALSGPIWSSMPFDPSGLSGFSALMLASDMTCLLGLGAATLVGCWLLCMRRAFHGQTLKLPILGRVAYIMIGGSTPGSNGSTH